MEPKIPHMPQVYPTNMKGFSIHNVVEGGSRTTGTLREWGNQTVFLVYGPYNFLHSLRANHLWKKILPGTRTFFFFFFFFFSSLHIWSFGPKRKISKLKDLAPWIETHGFCGFFPPKVLKKGSTTKVCPILQARPKYKFAVDNEGQQKGALVQWWLFSHDFTRV